MLAHVCNTSGGGRIVNKAELTKRQQLILEFIRVFHAANMYPPTIREIGRGVGVTSTSVVNYNLDKLRDAGWINRDGRVSCGLQLVNKPVRRIPARGGLRPCWEQCALSA